MSIENAQVAEVFDQLADLLEIEGENPFRVRAYRTAARQLQGLPHSVAGMVEQGEDLSELPGIGKDLAEKIQEVVGSGTLVGLEEAKRRLPAGLLEMVRLPGIGPKRAKLIFETLGIASVEELAQAAREERLRTVAGFGAKTEQNILNEIERAAAQPQQRLSLAVAYRIVGPLTRHLRDTPGVKEVTIAGSFRRGRDTVGDVDVLVVCDAGPAAMERLVGYEDVARVVSKGGTRSTVFLRSGLQVDVRVVPEESYGAALHYFTGSMAHNVAVRLLGVKRGLKINEYGVFRGEERVAGRSEEEVYRQVDLPYIEPELREDRGEIEAAQDGTLPHLVEEGDLRGDWHAHTTASDGRDSLEDMARAAQSRGYEYLAITEHSPSIARGLDAEGFREHLRRINGWNERTDGVVLLKGAEVDILEDGSLDLPHDVLAELDIVVCAIHSAYDLPKERQTERVLRALRAPYFTVLAHPTSRHIGERGPIDVDMERIVSTAKQTGSALEINAQPKRLDMNDIHAGMAREAGVDIVISTDAHSTAALEDVRFGVLQARRAWISPDAVLNTKGLESVMALVRGK